MSFIIISILVGCTSQKINLITGSDYDESKNQTEYFQLPFGSVTLPGKWERTKYNSISGQQFFIDKDSVSIAIAFNRYDKYEFNADGAKKGFEFVKAYYEWDSKYFVDSHGLKRKEIEKDSVKKYMIYEIFGETEKSKIDTYFLIGENNGNTSNFSISVTDKWTKNEKIGFLKNLFLTKK